MIVTLLDRSYNVLMFIDDYISLNWADRARKISDVELIVRATKEYMSAFKENLYLSIQESEKYMIIEKVLLNTSEEDGDTITVTGRSLESILDRRVIIPKLKSSGSAGATISSIITQNIVNPEDSSRKISNFVVGGIVSGGLIEQAQYFGDNVSTTVEALCEEGDINYKIVPYGSGGFLFSCSTGTDRSYSQSSRPYVVFSPEFENLISTRYVFFNGSEKNACYNTYTVTRNVIENKGDVEYPIYVTTVKQTDEFQVATRGSSSGLSRKEMAIEASSSPPTIGGDGGGTEEDLQEFEGEARQQARTELENSKKVEAIDGEVDYTTQFIYGVDYTLGDIVQVENQYGISARCRVSEYLISQDSSGLKKVPTFEFIT